jgi:hypothetical protein
LATKRKVSQKKCRTKRPTIRPTSFAGHRVSHLIHLEKSADRFPSPAPIIAS